jgi:hypothetical protein
MSLSISQPTVGTSATQVGVLTEGGQAVIAVAAGAANSVFVGTTSGVTALNGFPVTPGGPPVVITLPLTSASATLWAVAGAATQAFGLSISSTV